MTSSSHPDCPRCGKMMQLARILPRAFGHPELHSFACAECREAVTVEVGINVTADRTTGKDQP